MQGCLGVERTGGLIVVDQRLLLVQGLLRDVALTHELLISGEIFGVVRKRLLCLREGGARGLHLVAALPDVELLRVPGLIDFRVVGGGGANVGQHGRLGLCELRLQVGGVELRDHLARAHAVALVHGDRVGRLDELARDRDALQWGDHPGDR